MPKRVGHSEPTRSQRQEEIVEVATRLLQEQGPDALTTRAVAAEAGVQAPTIYRLFGDKGGLLDAVAQHVFATYIAGKSETDPTEDPVADLRAGWNSHIEFGLANPALFALLTSHRDRSPSSAAVAGAEILRARVERVAAAGRLRLPVTRAAAMIHAAGVGTVLSLLAMPPQDRDLGLGDEMWKSLMGSLVTAHPETSEAHATSRAAITLASNLSACAELTEAERRLMAEWLERISDSAADTSNF